MAATLQMTVRAAEDWAVGLILRAETGIPYMLLSVEAAIPVSVGVVLLNMLTEHIFRHADGYPRRLATLGVGALVVNGLTFGTSIAMARYQYPDTGFDWAKLIWLIRYGLVYGSLAQIAIRFAMVAVAQIARFDRRRPRSSSSPAEGD